MKVLITGGSGFIGSHLVAHLTECGYEVINVDCAAPTNKSKIAIWRNCSILNKNALLEVFREFQPQCIVHLAAYASMDARSLDEFRTNTDGTANVLDACKETASIERVVITSTQHVRRPGSPPPKSDVDYVPYMFYGESKVITEQLTRAANLKCAWTIIRPTAVWGPNQPPLADGVWKLIDRGLYFHPSGDPVIRSYGYVKNVVWQIKRLLQVPLERINRRTIYVGDQNIRQYDWVNGFARELTGRDVHTLPLWCIRVLARLGDGLKMVGLHFPMYNSRFQNLITTNPVFIQPTLELLGQPPFSLSEGIRETAKWLKSYYDNGL